MHCAKNANFTIWIRQVIWWWFFCSSRLKIFFVVKTQNDEMLMEMMIKGTKKRMGTLFVRLGRVSQIRRRENNNKIVGGQFDVFHRIMWSYAADKRWPTMLTFAYADRLFLRTLPVGFCWYFCNWGMHTVSEMATFFASSLSDTAVVVIAGALLLVPPFRWCIKRGGNQEKSQIIKRNCKLSNLENPIYYDYVTQFLNQRTITTRFFFLRKNDNFFFAFNLLFFFFSHTQSLRNNSQEFRFLWFFNKTSHTILLDGKMQTKMAPQREPQTSWTCWLMIVVELLVYLNKGNFVSGWMMEKSANALFKL